MDFTRGYDWEGDEKPAAMVYLKSKVRIRLTDPDKNPLPHGKCRLADAPGTIYECDDDGIVEIPIKSDDRTSLDLEWEPAGTADKGEEDRFRYCATFRLDVASANDDACQARLAHLTFEGDSLQAQVTAYQRYFGMPATGDIYHIRQQLIDWHDGGDRPTRGDSPASQPTDLPLDPSEPEPLSKVFDEGADGSLKLKPAVRSHLQKLMDRLEDANGYRLVVANVTFLKKTLPNGGLAHTVRDVVEVSPDELQRPVQNQIYTLSHELTHVLQFKVSPGDDDDAKWQSMIARYKEDERKYGKDMQYFVDNDLQSISIDRIQVLDQRFPLEAIARKVGAEGQASLFDRG